MSHSTEACYLPHPGFILREIAGEALLVPVGEQTQTLNGFVTLTSTGAFIWKQLNGTRTAQEVAALLAAECNTAMEKILPDVLEFLQHAHSAGLLVIA